MIAFPVRDGYPLCAEKKPAERMTNMERKSISSKIPVELHHWIETELRPDNSVLSGFIEDIIERYYELKEAGIPVAKKPNIVSFPVSDELYQRIEAQLAEHKRVHGNKLTQEEYVAGLVVQALDVANIAETEE